MIEIECPACNQVFTAEDEQLGGMVTCPHCAGEIDMTDEVIDEASPPDTGGTIPPKRRVISQPRQAPATSGPPHTQVISNPPSNRPPIQTSQSAPLQQPVQAPIQTAPSPVPRPQKRGPMPVVITDVRLTMKSMCVLAIKWTIACIPAMIILWVIVGLVTILFGGILAGIFSSFLQGK